MSSALVFCLFHLFQQNKLNSVKTSKPYGNSHKAGTGNFRITAALCSLHGYIGNSWIDNFEEPEKRGNIEWKFSIVENHMCYRLDKVRLTVLAMHRLDWNSMWITIYFQKQLKVMRPAGIDLSSFGYVV